MRNLEVLGPHDRLPPQSQEAEASTLGAMLLSRDAVAHAMEILTPSDFYRMRIGRSSRRRSGCSIGGNPLT
jgi:hypothetical protein